MDDYLADLQPTQECGVCDVGLVDDHDLWHAERVDLGEHLAYGGEL